MKKHLTLCIVHKGDQVLLGMKKQGFGAGRWNGFGGKVQSGESIDEAAKREMREESSVEIEKMEKVGVIDFEFVDSPEILEVHIYKVNEFQGQGEESDEMRPKWFYIDEIPFNLMWPDDRYWFPLFLAGKKFTGRFLFKGENTIIEHKLIEHS